MSDPSGLLESGQLLSDSESHHERLSHQSDTGRGETRGFQLTVAVAVAVAVTVANAIAVTMNMTMTMTMDGAVAMDGGGGGAVTVGGWQRLCL